MNQIDWLNRTLKYTVENYEIMFDEMSKSDDEYKKISFAGVWTNDVIYQAIKELNVQKDMKKIKQFFYTSARLEEFLIKKVDNSRLDYDVKVLCFPLLSDCKSLIERYGSLRHKNYKPLIESGDSTFIYIIQSILREDWKDFTYLMNIMEEKSLKKHYSLLYDYNFFNSILKKIK